MPIIIIYILPFLLLFAFFWFKGRCDRLEQRLDLLEKEFASFRQSTNKTDHDSGPSKGI